eukprot:TRINITY_DN29445_c0_g2_i1.p2 TRINITY_DN29445_c0_g2~~TRINITY_DN29445_c0_g2_i1.p2  ORF type:complete len:230 (+),score=18.72 TRINITY_DN29445_c0_g2_i1:512-1201(+)
MHLPIAFVRIRPLQAIGLETIVEFVLMAGTAYPVFLHVLFLLTKYATAPAVVMVELRETVLAAVTVAIMGLLALLCVPGALLHLAQATDCATTVACAPALLPRRMDIGAGHCATSAHYPTLVACVISCVQPQSREALALAGVFAKMECAFRATAHGVGKRAEILVQSVIPLRVPSQNMGRPVSWHALGVTLLAVAMEIVPLVSLEPACVLVISVGCRQTVPSSAQCTMV